MLKEIPKSEMALSFGKQLVVCFVFVFGFSKWLFHFTFLTAVYENYSGL